jgi:hypothetical protein
MTEIIALLLLLGAGYLIINGIYHSGKAEGSRKGYNVGRRRSRRRW